MCVLVSTFKHFEWNTTGKQFQLSVPIPDVGLLPVPLVPQRTAAIALVLEPKYLVLEPCLLNYNLQKSHVTSQWCDFDIINSVRI